MEEPENQGPLTALIEGPAAESFDLATAGTIAVSTAALIAFQTCFKFERDKEGKFYFKIERPTPKDPLVLSLAQMLMTYLGRGRS